MDRRSAGRPGERGRGATETRAAAADPRPTRIPLTGSAMTAIGVAGVPKDSTAPRGTQCDSAILQGSIAAWQRDQSPPGQGPARRTPGPGGGTPPPSPCERARFVFQPRLTPLRGRAYHPPDEERAMRRWVLGAFACLQGSCDLTKPRGLMERIPHSPDEADLSAQEAPSRQGARLPRPDEVLGRPTCSGRTPGSRSKAPVGLTSGRAPVRSRIVMLSRPQDFTALQERGTMRSHPLLAARVLRTDLETTRFAMATSRAIGSAVVRNRVRRRIREALRSMGPSIRPGWDVLLVARAGLVGVDYDTGVKTLRRQLVRGGVMEGSDR